MIRIVAPLLVLGLAACGSEPDQPKTPEQVQAEANKLAKQAPGLYRMTTEVLSVDAAGLAPDQADVLQQKADVKPEVSEQCVTEADSEKGIRDMVQGISEASGAGSCSFSKFSVTGNALDSKMTCKGPVGAGGDIAIAGTVGETGVDLIMDMKVDASVMGNIGIKMKITSERIGDCP